MATLNDFQAEFDKNAQFKKGDGSLRVAFLTQGGSRYPGEMRFANGLLVSAQMDGFDTWKNPDECD